MQEQNKSKLNIKTVESKPIKASEEQRSASGRWSAMHRVRLPHKAGLPLSSGGGGDQIER